MIMIFQGHPELSRDVSEEVLRDLPAYMNVTKGQKPALAKSPWEHDGYRIWEKILLWAYEYGERL